MMLIEGYKDVLRMRFYLEKKHSVANCTTVARQI